MTKTIKIAGYILLLGGIIFILIGHIGVWVTDGFVEMLQLWNPFNVANYIVMIATLSPGALLVYWSGKREEKENGYDT